MLPPADTWETFSDKYLLPDVVYYGQRRISLQRFWELTSRRTTILDSSRAYKILFDIYREGAYRGSGPDGEFTAWDEGWAAGLYLALGLVRATFNLPIPPLSAPPTVAEPTAHPGKELV